MLEHTEYNRNDGNYCIANDHAWATRWCIVDFYMFAISNCCMLPNFQMFVRLLLGQPLRWVDFDKLHIDPIKNSIRKFCFFVVYLLMAQFLYRNGLVSMTWMMAVTMLTLFPNFCQSFYYLSILCLLLYTVFCRWFFCWNKENKPNNNNNIIDT